MKKSEKIEIEIETADLNPTQRRQLKSLVTLISHVVNTDNEGEYFDGSAEVMRICASLIKQAKFVENFSEFDGIPYAEQALEFSVDVLQEYMSDANVVQYDN